MSNHDEMESRLQKAWAGSIRFSLTEVAQVIKAELAKVDGVDDQDSDVCKAILMVGEAGIGKSQIFAQTCAAVGAEAIKHHHGATVPEDNHGNPMISGDKTVHAVAAHCVPFQRAPRSTSGRGAWLLDETLSGSSKEHETFLRMVIDRRLDEHTMYPGWLLVGATNPPTAKYTTVREPDHSLEDRFIIMPVEVSADDRLAYWSGRMPKLMHQFLLMNVKNSVVTDMVTRLSSRQWSVLAHTIAKLDAAKSGINVISKVMNINAGIEIGTAFTEFLAKGSDPNCWPIAAADLMNADAQQYTVYANRVERWAEKRSERDSASDALIGATKFDLEAWLQNDPARLSKPDKQVTANLAKFMTLLADLNFADMAESLFSVVKQTEMMKAILDAVRGNSLEKKMIKLLESNKQLRYEQIKIEKEKKAAEEAAKKDAKK